MGKKSSSAPAAPDPNALAAAQSAANKDAVYETAKVNQINEVSPWGTQTYTGEIGSPDRTRTVALSPEQQQVYNQQTQIANILAGQASNRANQITPDAFNYDGISPISGSDDILNASQPLEQATYDRSMIYLDPQFQREQQDTMASLDARGLPQGGEAWSRSMGDVMDSQNRARTDAALASVAAGRQEQSRLFGMEQAARQQGINERIQERTQPINELSAALQGAPALQAPQFGSPAQYQVAPPDVMGANALAYQGAQNAYNQSQANSRGLMGGAFGLGSSAMMSGMFKSDRRVKKDIRRVGTTDGGAPVYTFRYKSGGPMQMGVMAQDIEKITPAAVAEIGGVKHVNYAMVR